MLPQPMPHVQAEGGVLATMPPEVAACWRQWTGASTFRPALVDAALRSPPLSAAYRSGDTCGSSRVSLPPPGDLLPLRWRRAGDRAEGFQEDVPEPPEHLSRAYTCAFLRDVGQHIGRDPTFASMPDTRDRYPHLSRLVSTFGRRQAIADEGSAWV